jgi:Xaa-Pro aminopeptidase
MSSEEKKSGRVYDVEPSQLYAEFMKTGWTPSPLHGITPDDVATYAFSRRQALSRAFPGLRLILPSGNYKVRSNDTDYLYRPHSAFAYYTGVQGVEATADAVLVMEPHGDSHDPILFINPRSTRDTDAFYKDARYGELWVGRRFTLEEAQARYQITTRKISELEEFLAKDKGALVIRDQDTLVDSLIKKSAKDDELANFTSVHRMIKDDYEIKEMQRAVDATHAGFSDIIRAFPAAVQTPRGERVVEAAFYGRARIEGNDLGYNTIAASGAHACVLHWTRNDGAVHNGQLILIDAGIEMDSYYTADITRTLPVS